ncbi:potassium/proton antiporter [Angustibacter sp. McL0619]|uniref:potassium/proton antiporter n=1 Tax=Angustibacter sp. McL0619 TaxID=3415676 RepID=UPI003CED6753
MSVDLLNHSLLLGTAVVLVAIAAVRFSLSSGLPSLLLYLALGLVLGEDAIGINFDDQRLTQVLGFGALALILAEGGLTTRWTTIRHALAPAAVLATVGVVVSVLVVGAAAFLLLDLPWTVALLVGAVLSSTDAAAVFSVLRRVPIHPRLAGVLEAESGLNDAPVVLLVVALSEQAASDHGGHPWYVLVPLAAFELAAGAAIGLGVGWLGAKGLRRLALPSSALTSLAVLTLTVGAYALGATLHTSGFLAVYVAGLVLGNSEMPHRTAVRGFAEAVGWLAQIGLFVLLGLLASPGDLDTQVWPALALGVVLLLVARPLSVLVSMTPFRMPWRQQAFLSWAGLRGAVPVVLATVPVTTGVPGVEWLFDLVFVLVVVFTLVQGPTLPFMARRLHVEHTMDSRDLDVESAPLDELGAEILQVRIGQDSRLHGLEVFELRLPRGANIALVVREQNSFVPGDRTVLRRGDQLLVVTTQKVRRETQRRLRALSLGGRLALWGKRPP